MVIFNRYKTTFATKHMELYPGSDFIISDIRAVYEAKENSEKLHFNLLGVSLRLRTGYHDLVSVGVPYREDWEYQPPILGQFDVSMDFNIFKKKLARQLKRAVVERNLFDRLGLIGIPDEPPDSSYAYVNSVDYWLVPLINYNPLAAQLAIVGELQLLDFEVCKHWK